MILRDVLDRSTAYLAEKGVPSPRVDAEHLLAHALGLTRIGLYLEFDRPLMAAELDAARELVRRRGTREPLAYVLGEWGFRRLTLSVDARVLVPRPETEIVVERCLRALVGVEAPRVLDVGTGSGAIALAIADECEGATVLAVDVSPDALAVAGTNAERTGLADRVELREHDLHAGLPAGPFDLVVSNPPYVEPEDVDTLQDEVREWEPRGALVGVGATEAVVRGAREVLAPGGVLVLEVGDGTAGTVAELLRAAGYDDVAIGDDLAGRERVVEGRRG